MNIKNNNATTTAPCNKNPLIDAETKKRDLIELATNQNTKDAMRDSIKHFEKHFGGKLPCNSQVLGDYLVSYADRLAPNTLELRRSMLSRWHRENGYADPSEEGDIKKIMKGIRLQHSKPTKQAKAMSESDINNVINSLESLVIDADLIYSDPRRQRGLQLKSIRDKALFLTGFWLGIRGENLLNIEVQHLGFSSHAKTRVMEVFLPTSKTDKEAKGTTFTLQEMPRLCPVKAMQDWLEASHFDHGPVFVRVDMWGNLSDKAMNRKSLSELIRSILHSAGIAAQDYTSHSFRRGLANWITQNGGSLNDTMTWIGWTDTRSAIRYQDASESLLHKLMSKRLQQPTDT